MPGLFYLLNQTIPCGWDDSYFIGEETEAQSDQDVCQSWYVAELAFELTPPVTRKPKLVLTHCLPRVFLGRVPETLK